MALSDRGVFERSPPSRVIFAGLEGYSPNMETQGWEFYLERENHPGGFMRERFSMTMRHRPSGLVAIAEGFVDQIKRAAFDPGFRESPTFVVNRVVHERHTEMVMASAIVPNFDRVSMHPSYADTATLRRFKLADLFTPWAPEAQEIIVEPATVAGLMEEIRRLQQPELAEIRRRAYVKGRDQPTQDTMVAQIIAFSA